MPAKRSAGGPSVAQKRTRFAASASPADSPSADVDDAYLEEDLPEGGAKARQKVRRSLKDQEGYGSDSSNDEEGVVPSRRPGTKDEDDDVDMFADDVDEDKDKKDKGKGKEFLDLSEIEGQEFDQTNAAAKGEGDDSDSDDEEKRKNTGTGLDGDMGIDITPFNMKNEMQEGRFTADGEAYEENDKDPNEKHDMWLANLDKDEIKKARRAHREREKAEKEKEEKEAAGGEEKKREEEKLLREAVDLMQRGETVLEALQRLGKEVEEKRKKDEQGNKKKSWAEKQRERKALMAAQEEQSDPIHTSNPFTNLSNIVSGLTTIGHLDVYSLSRESIQRMLPQNASNGSSRPAAAAPAPPPIDNRQFEYRFSMAYVRNLPEAQRPIEREVFGPFSLLQLRGWRSSGFFGSPACENVELRVAGTEGGAPGSWGSWAAIVESR
ncbi:hypothetical protein CI109_104847 [Kwoniella shandongensis]|uniref:Uncharacterized protein n=1 Tax=Kwoniella shandongensis TaxID=1734106 RepID=A0A5M6BRU2_9TREE|nr:uncharacterized protein CI109_006168 [Kwoniella shandongensis]KAA5525477.1 hypothetical protein CI109_006168 [Kwoniella shandongensis]